jgi:hypothetical protein
MLAAPGSLLNWLAIKIQARKKLPLILAMGVFNLTSSAQTQPRLTQDNTRHLGQ